MAFKNDINDINTPVEQIKQPAAPNKNIKLCKTCGAAIAKNAKRCPSCGAKNKKPIFKRVLFCFIAILLVVIIAEVITSFINPSHNNNSDPLAERTILNVGQTATTDTVQLTLDKVQFVEKLGLDYTNWLKPVSSGGGLVSGDGEEYVWFSFTAKNISKNELSGYSVCTAKLDFNNGFIYDDTTFASEDLPKYSTSKGISSNIGLVPMKPLETKGYYGFVECVSEVKSNLDLPRLLVFTLPDSNGNKEFAFQF